MAPLDILTDINVATAVLFLIIFMLAHTLYTQPSVSNRPPGPFALPFVGTMLQLGRDIREPLLQLGHKYGDVFSIYMGSRHVVVLNSYDVIKEAMVEYGDVFNNRARIFLFDELFKGLGIISVDGEFWKEQRRFTHSVLRDFGMGKNKIQEKIQEECQYFLQSMGDEGETGPYDPHKLTQTAVANIITSVIFGRRYEYSDPLFKEYMFRITRMIKHVASTALMVIFPFIRSLHYLPFDLFGFKELLLDQSWLEREYFGRVNERKNDFDPHNIRDFIEAYIKKMSNEDVKADPRTNFTDKQLLQIIADLFAAGTETSSTTLNWAIAYMIHYPDIQAKVQNEIDAVIGSSRQPTYDDRMKMPLTEACLLEVQRLGDIVPLGVPHETASDVVFHDFFIPKGTIIISNLNAVHMDERTWKNPNNFDPYRFLDDDENVINRDKIMPFGIGRRRCLGEALATMELFIFFTSMLQHFTFKKPVNCPLPHLIGVLGITCEIKSFKLALDKR